MQEKRIGVILLHIQWNPFIGREKYSRVDAATILFFKIKKYLADIIQRSEGNIIRATKSVNKHFKMKNDFPIFMAITDIAWFRPDIINPASPVPTGIGAVAF